MNDRQELIEKTLAAFNDDARYCKIDNDLYLTNSKLLFKFPGYASDFQKEDILDIRAENIERVWANAIPTQESEIVEKICALAPAPVPCPECEGRGFLLLCDECQGTGICFCSECDSEYKCKSCKGTMVSPTGKEKANCDLCGNTGQSFQTVSIFSQKFQVRLLRMIAEVAPLSRLYKPMGNSAAFFTNDSVTGLIMPCFG